MGVTNKSVFINLIWRFAERCGAQGVSFVVSIILARLLAPEAYGLVALVNVFIVILQVFVDSGFGNALIQKKDADDLDFSTVFYFNIALCVVLYILMYFASPFIADFYGKAELTPIVRAMSLSLIISGVKNVQQAYVSKMMMFKRFFFATLGGTVGAAVIGIIMAYMGFGVWALVAQTLFNALAGTVILWVTVKWRPKLMFSFKRLKGLFSYGWKLLASALIDTVYSNIRQLIIGKLYNADSLAFYNKGRSFPYMITTNINSSIDSVLFPTMSDAQNDKERVHSMTRRAIKTSSYIIWPMMTGLAVCAEPFVRLLLTEKWMECVPYIRIFCIAFGFLPIHTANLNAIKAMGRSDIYLKLEIIKKVIGIVVLISVMWHGVLAMAYSLFIMNILSSFINSYPNKKLLDYSYMEQIRDMLPSMALSAVMGIIVYMIQLAGFGDIITLVLQIVSGAVIYIALSKLFKLECFDYIIKFIKKLRERKV